MKAKDLKPQFVTPLVSLQIENWPPPDADRDRIARLATKIACDIERMLTNLRSAPSGMRSEGAALRRAPTDDADSDLGGGDDKDLLDCTQVGSGYEIIEIGGVARECRVDWFRCPDGRTYRRVFPL